MVGATDVLVVDVLDTSMGCMLDKLGLPSSVSIPTLVVGATDVLVVDVLDTSMGCMLDNLVAGA